MLARINLKNNEYNNGMRKKLFLLAEICVILFMSVILVRADESLTAVLSYALKNDSSLFFAYNAQLQGGKRLLTVSDTDTGFVARAYDEEDGAEICDEFDIVTGGGNSYRLSVINDGTYDLLMLETNSVKECISLLEDSFVRRDMPIEYKTVIRVAEEKKWVKEYFGNSRSAAYNLLNRMKEEQLKGYSFIDRCGSIDGVRLKTVKDFIAASADMMSYDSKNHDFDRTMKYILNTNANFQIINPYERGVYDNSYEGIRLVRADYIDYILKNVFGLEPQHPYINELTTRGFCVNDGYYNYVPSFGENFSTEIREIKKIYDVGNNVYFIVFTDIYTENGYAVPEYSWAVLKEENGLKLLRIEMGAELPQEHEIMEYAGVNEYEKYAWEKNTGNNFLAKLKNLWYYINRIMFKKR